MLAKQKVYCIQNISMHRSPCLGDNALGSCVPHSWLLLQMMEDDASGLTPDPD